MKLFFQVVVLFSERIERTGLKTVSGAEGPRRIFRQVRGEFFVRKSVLERFCPFAKISGG